MALITTIDVFQAITQPKWNSYKIKIFSKLSVMQESASRYIFEGISECLQKLFSRRFGRLLSLAYLYVIFPI